MNNTEKDIEQFDAFIKGTLKGDELTVFNKKLAEDASFAEDFRLHELIVSGIRDHGRTELKDFIRNNANPPLEKKIFSLRKYMLAAAVIVLLIGLYAVMQFYIRPGESTQIVTTENVSDKTTWTDSPNRSMPLEQTPESDVLSAYKKENPGMANPNDKEMSVPPTTSESEDLAYYESNFGTASGAQDYDRDGIENKIDDAKNLETNKDRYLVKTEEKLGDTFILADILYAELETPVIDVQNTYSNNNVFRNKSAAQPKTPTDVSNVIITKKKSTEKAQKEILADSTTITSAKKNEAENELKMLPAKRAINVEVWQSPINFRGYKYLSNKLQVYGMSANGLRLFIYDGSLYLRNQGKVYLIVTCPSACPFVELTDAATLEFILKQN